jgi:O-antigen ligase
MINFKNFKFETIYSFLWVGFLIVFFVAPKISTLILILSVLFFIYSLITKKVIFSFKKLYIPFILFYIAYVVGVLFTNHTSVALKILENKLSLLIFPFLFSFRLSDKTMVFRKITIGLIVGVILSSLVGVFNAFKLYFVNHSILSFLTIGISPIHHPSYFVVFHIVSSVLFIYGFQSKWSGFTRKKMIVFLMFSFVFQCLCLSLAGLIFLFSIFFVGVLFYLYKRLSKNVFRISALILPFLLIGIFFSVPQFEGEFNGAFKYAKDYFSNPKEFVLSRKDNLSGTEERLIMWTVTYYEILDFPLGVGTGNVDEHLSKRLNAFGLHKLAKKNYNPHNQFLQTSLEVGVISMIILLFGLFIWIRKGIQTRFWPLIIVCINLIFNSFFESMLQRQSGIVFYTFIMCLFILICSNNNQDESISSSSL